MAETLFEIRLTGGGLLPETLPIQELADILKSVELILGSVAIDQNQGLNSEDFIVGLVHSEKGSARLKFASTLSEVAMAALMIITSAISTREYNNIPTNAIKGLKDLSNYTAKRDCDLQIYKEGSFSAPLAEISANVSLSLPCDLTVTGKTIIYGQILRIGGAEPKVAVRTLDNDLLYCTLSESLARLLANSLYETVGLAGSATWELKSYRILEFNAEEIIPYHHGDLLSAFASLRKAVDGAFDDIDDVEEYVLALRGGDED